MERSYRSRCQSKTKERVICGTFIIWLSALYEKKLYLEIVQIFLVDCLPQFTDHGYHFIQDGTPICNSWLSYSVSNRRDLVWLLQADICMCTSLEPWRDVSFLEFLFVSCHLFHSLARSPFPINPPSSPPPPSCSSSFALPSLHPKGTGQAREGIRPLLQCHATYWQYCLVVGHNQFSRCCCCCFHSADWEPDDGDTAVPHHHAVAMSHTLPHITLPLRPLNLAPLGPPPPTPTSQPFLFSHLPPCLEVWRKTVLMAEEENGTDAWQCFFAAAILIFLCLPPILEPSFRGRHQVPKGSAAAQLFPRWCWNAPVSHHIKRQDDPCLLNQ